MKQPLLAFGLLLMLAGCNTPTAVMRGNELTLDCMVSDRHCTGGYGAATYAGVSMQQALNAVQRVWMQEGYDSSRAVVTPEGPQTDNAGNPIVPTRTLVRYGPAVRYYPEGENGCFWQRAIASISQPHYAAGQLPPPVSVAMYYRVKECRDQGRYLSGSTTDPQSLANYKDADGFIHTQRAPRYGREFYEHLDAALGVTGQRY